MLAFAAGRRFGTSGRRLGVAGRRRRGRRRFARRRARCGERCSARGGCGAFARRAVCRGFAAARFAAAPTTAVRAATPLFGSAAAAAFASRARAAGLLLRLPLLRFGRCGARLRGRRRIADDDRDRGRFAARFLAADCRHPRLVSTAAAECVGDGGAFGRGAVAEAPAEGHALAFLRTAGAGAEPDDLPGVGGAGRGRSLDREQVAFADADRQRFAAGGGDVVLGVDFVQVRRFEQRPEKADAGLVDGDQRRPLGERRRFGEIGEGQVGRAAVSAGHRQEPTRVRVACRQFDHSAHRHSGTRFRLARFSRPGTQRVTAVAGGSAPDRFRGDELLPASGQVHDHAGIGRRARGRDGRPQQSGG